MSQKHINATYQNRPAVLILALAFASIYIFWGSTYLAIKYAIETMPPFIMAGTRFLIAGGVLFAIALTGKDFERPTLRHWRTSLIVGTLLLLGGNGLVVFAERYIASSLAALLVAVEPFWIVLLSWLWLGHRRPGRRVVIGLFVGFIGVALLVAGQSGDNGASVAAGGYGIIATAAVILAALCWATGSIYGLRAPVPRSALLTAGMQMISGGSVLLAASFAKGEWSGFDVSSVSTASWLSFGYLVVFGSLISFTAYSWLLKNARPSAVATYAYVNPVVAVVLGWGFAGETLTARMLIGATLVVISVLLVTVHQGESTADADSDDLSISAAPAMTTQYVSTKG